MSGQYSNNPNSTSNLMKNYAELSNTLHNTSLTPDQLSTTKLREYVSSQYRNMDREKVNNLTERRRKKEKYKNVSQRSLFDMILYGQPVSPVLLKIRVNQPDQYGNTPLHQGILLFANQIKYPSQKVLLNHLDNLPFFSSHLDEKIQIDQIHAKLDQILPLSLQYSGLISLDYLLFLLSLGADINIPNRQGHTPLFYAIMYGLYEIIPYFLLNQTPNLLICPFTGLFLGPTDCNVDHIDEMMSITDGGGEGDLDEGRNDGDDIDATQFSTDPTPNPPETLTNTQITHRVVLQSDENQNGIDFGPQIDKNEKIVGTNFAEQNSTLPSSETSISSPPPPPPPPSPPSPSDDDYQTLINLIQPNNDKQILLYTILLSTFLSKGFKTALLFSLLFHNDDNFFHFLEQNLINLDQILQNSQQNPRQNSLPKTKIATNISQPPQNPHIDLFNARIGSYNTIDSDEMLEMGPFDFFGPITNHLTNIQTHSPHNPTNASHKNTQYLGDIRFIPFISPGLIVTYSKHQTIQTTPSIPLYNFAQSNPYLSSFMTQAISTFQWGMGMISSSSAAIRHAISSNAAFLTPFFKYFPYFSQNRPEALTYEPNDQIEYVNGVGEVGGSDVDGDDERDLIELKDTIDPANGLDLYNKKQYSPFDLTQNKTMAEKNMKIDFVEKNDRADKKNNKKLGQQSQIRNQLILQGQIDNYQNNTEDFDAFDEDGEGELELGGFFEENEEENYEFQDEIIYPENFRRKFLSFLTLVEDDVIMDPSDKYDITLIDHDGTRVRSLEHNGQYYDPKQGKKQNFDFFAQNNNNNNKNPPKNSILNTHNFFIPKTTPQSPPTPYPLTQIEKEKSKDDILTSLSQLPSASTLISRLSKRVEETYFALNPNYYSIHSFSYEDNKVEYSIIDEPLGGDGGKKWEGGMNGLRDKGNIRNKQIDEQNDEQNNHNFNPQKPSPFSPFSMTTQHNNQPQTPANHLSTHTFLHSLSSPLLPYLHQPYIFFTALQNQPTFHTIIYLLFISGTISPRWPFLPQSHYVPIDHQVIGDRIDVDFEGDGGGSDFDEKNTNKYQKMRKINKISFPWLHIILSIIIAKTQQYRYKLCQIERIYIHLNQTIPPIPTIPREDEKIDPFFIGPKNSQNSRNSQNPRNSPHPFPPLLDIPSPLAKQAPELLNELIKTTVGNISSKVTATILSAEKKQFQNSLISLKHDIITILDDITVLIDIFQYILLISSIGLMGRSGEGVEEIENNKSNDNNLQNNQNNQNNDQNPSILSKLFPKVLSHMILFYETQYQFPQLTAMTKFITNTIHNDTFYNAIIPSPIDIQTVHCGFTLPQLISFISIPNTQPISQLYYKPIEMAQNDEFTGIEGSGGDFVQEKCQILPKMFTIDHFTDKVSSPADLYPPDEYRHYTNNYESLHSIHSYFLQRFFFAFYFSVQNLVQTTHFSSYLPSPSNPVVDPDSSCPYTPYQIALLSNQPIVIADLVKCLDLTHPNNQNDIDSHNYQQSTPSSPFHRLFEAYFEPQQYKHWSYHSSFKFLSVQPFDYPIFQFSKIDQNIQINPILEPNLSIFVQNSLENSTKTSPPLPSDYLPSSIFYKLLTMTSMLLPHTAIRPRALNYSTTQRGDVFNHAFDTLSNVYSASISSNLDNMTSYTPNTSFNPFKLNFNKFYTEYHFAYAQNYQINFFLQFFSQKNVNQIELTPIQSPSSQIIPLKFPSFRFGLDLVIYSIESIIHSEIIFNIFKIMLESPLKISQKRNNSNFFSNPAQISSQSFPDHTHPLDSLRLPNELTEMLHTILDTIFFSLTPNVTLSSLLYHHFPSKSILDTLISSLPLFSTGNTRVDGYVSHANCIPLDSKPNITSDQWVNGQLHGLYTYIFNLLIVFLQITHNNQEDTNCSGFYENFLDGFFSGGKISDSQHLNVLNPTQRLLLNILTVYKSKIPLLNPFYTPQKDNMDNFFDEKKNPGKNPEKSNKHLSSEPTTNMNNIFHLLLYIYPHPNIFSYIFSYFEQHSPRQLDYLMYERNSVGVTPMELLSTMYGMIRPKGYIQAEIGQAKNDEKNDEKNEDSTNISTGSQAPPKRVLPPILTQWGLTTKGLFISVLQEHSKVKSEQSPENSQNEKNQILNQKNQKFSKSLVDYWFLIHKTILNLHEDYLLIIYDNISKNVRNISSDVVLNPIARAE